MPYVHDHYVGGELPCVVRIHYDLRTILVVARPARLPTLVEDPGCHDEGGEELQRNWDKKRAGTSAPALGVSL